MKLHERFSKHKLSWCRPQGCCIPVIVVGVILLQSIRTNAQDTQAYPAHTQVFLRDRFPSATACGECHLKHYRQWSVSQHAYAQMSPVFNAMHGTIVKLTNETNGDFCIRCHTPAGMNLKEREFMSNIDRNPTSREGIT